MGRVFLRRGGINLSGEPMNRRDAEALDRHITGNYGEDQLKGDITEYLIERLAEISNLPTHPCDDFRNLIALLKAKMLADEAITKWENGE